MILQDKQFEIWQSVMNLKRHLRPMSSLASPPCEKLWQIWVEVYSRYGKDD